MTTKTNEVSVVETIRAEIENNLSLNPRNNGEFESLAGNKHRFSLREFAKQIVDQERLANTELPDGIVIAFSEQLDSDSPDFGPVAQVLDEIEQVSVEDYELWKSEVYDNKQSSNTGTSVTKADLVKKVEAQTAQMEQMQRSLESLRNAVSDLLKSNQRTTE